MERKHHNTELHRTTVWRNILLVGMGLSLCSNVVQGLALFNNQQTTIMVPSPAGQVYQIGKTVNAAYLEDIARDVVTTILNVHPGSTDYVRDAVLKFSHPAFYGAFKRQFDTWLEDIRGRKLSTAFYPNSITAHPNTLKVDVRGVLQSYIGESQVDTEEVTYQIEFSLESGRLSLTKFEEVVQP